jgi:hypothetical protein
MKLVLVRFSVRIPAGSSAILPEICSRFSSVSRANIHLSSYNSALYNLDTKSVVKLPTEETEETHEQRQHSRSVPLFETMTPPPPRGVNYSPTRSMSSYLSNQSISTITEKQNCTKRVTGVSRTTTCWPHRPTCRHFR